MSTSLLLSLDRVDADIGRLQSRERALVEDLAKVRDELPRLVAFREMAIRYGQPDWRTTSTIDYPAHPKNGQEAIKVPRPGSKSALLGDACVDALLATEKSHLPIRELFEATQARGIVIGTKDEIVYLSGVLGHDPRVTYERQHGGWRLATSEPRQEDETAGSPFNKEPAASGSSLDLLSGPPTHSSAVEPVAGGGI